MLALKTTIISAVFTFFCFTASAQKNIEYTVTAEANALMCPFLSPQLMDRLAKYGAEDVTKDASLRLHFTTSAEKEMSDELILKLVEDVGYQAK
jgi:hypothetical protein